MFSSSVCLQLQLANVRTILYGTDQSNKTWEMFSSSSAAVVFHLDLVFFFSFSCHNKNVLYSNLFFLWFWPLFYQLSSLKQLLRHGNTVILLLYYKDDYLGEYNAIIDRNDGQNCKNMIQVVLNQKFLFCFFLKMSSWICLFPSVTLPIRYRFSP